jgi:hypothetical protein
MLNWPPASLPNRVDTDGNPICPGCKRAIRLEGAAELAVRPVRVESDYLVHLRCWNPLAVATTSPPLD